MALRPSHRKALFASYLVNEAQGNKTQAARLAGYRNARASGLSLAKDPYVKDLIREKIAGLGMPKDEALLRLKILASADLEDFCDFPTDDLDAPPINLHKARRLGMLPCIKKYKRTRRIHTDADGNTEETITAEIELHHSQAAVEAFLKIHKVIGGPDDDAGKDVKEMSEDELKAITGRSGRGRA